MSEYSILTEMYVESKKEYHQRQETCDDEHYFLSLLKGLTKESSRASLEKKTHEC